MHGPRLANSIHLETLTAIVPREQCGGWRVELTAECSVYDGDERDNFYRAVEPQTILTAEYDNDSGNATWSMLQAAAYVSEHQDEFEWL